MEDLLAELHRRLHRRVATGDGVAAASGVAAEGRGAGVAENNAHLRDVDAELIRNDLTDRRLDAVALRAAARAHQDLSAAVDADRHPVTQRANTERAGFDEEADPHSEVTPFGSGRQLLAAEVLITKERGGPLEGSAGVIAS